MTTASAPRTDRLTAPDVARLSALVDEAARTDLGAAAWTSLADRASLVTTDLAAAGSLPPHLVVAPADPPVAIARTLLVAARAAGHAAAARATTRGTAAARETSVVVPVTVA